MRILYIAGHEFLYNPQIGGQKGSLRIYELLKKIIGEENLYLCMFSNYKYKNLHKNIKIFPTQKNVFQLVKNTLSTRNVCDRKTLKEAIKYIENFDCDLLFCDSSTIGSLLNQVKGNMPKIVFFHNIEKNYAKNKVKHEGIHYLIAYFSYSINEKKAIQSATKLIFLNSRDAQEAKKIYHCNADFMLPVTFADIFDKNLVIKDKESSNKKSLLFVGTLFPPNYDGINWFVKNVMNQLPEFELTIIGKNMEKRRKNLSRNNVKVVGTVENLAEFYYAADAVVIPVFYGDGMKVKTAEALMFGKTIFAAPEALEGYYKSGIQGLYRCNSEDEFILNIKKFFDKKNKCKCNENIRKYFLENFESNSHLVSLNNFLINAVEDFKKINFYK